MKKKKKPISRDFIYNVIIVSTWVLILAGVVYKLSGIKQPTECPRDSVIDYCRRECLNDSSNNKLIVEGDNFNFKMVCFCNQKGYE